MKRKLGQRKLQLSRETLGRISGSLTALSNGCVVGTGLLPGEPGVVLTPDQVAGSQALSLCRACTDRCRTRLGMWWCF